MSRISPLVPSFVLCAFAVLSPAAYAGSIGPATSLGAFGNLSVPGSSNDGVRGAFGGGAKIGLGLILAGIEVSAGTARFDGKDGREGRSIDYVDVDAYFPFWVWDKRKSFGYVALGGGHFMTHPGDDGPGATVGAGFMLFVGGLASSGVFLDTSVRYRDLSGGANDFTELRFGLTFCGDW